VYEDKLTCNEYQKFDRNCLTCDIHHPINLNIFNFIGKLTLNNQLKILEYRKHIGFGNKKIITYIFCMCINKDNKIPAESVRVGRSGVTCWFALVSGNQVPAETEPIVR